MCSEVKSALFTRASEFFELVFLNTQSIKGCEKKKKCLSSFAEIEKQKNKMVMTSKVILNVKPYLRNKKMKNSM